MKWESDMRERGGGEEERESTALQLCLNVKRKIISVAQGSEEAILVLERVCRVLDHSALSLSLIVCPTVSLISASGIKVRRTESF